MESSFEHNETEIRALVDRFEEMLKSNGSYFFDVEDFEDIIDFYLDNQNVTRSKKAIEMAEAQHPGATVILIKKARFYLLSNKPTKALSLLDEMEKIDFLFNKLNRPIRVCGMVKNEGEPGGGPFWVVNENGEKSLQIVESSQIDFSDKEQKDIVSKSTHFNPVDLVCGVYDFKGEKFNLLDFVDPNSGFISNKSKDGSVLKAMELPGLWNGAMTDWITIFIETPIITFNPVKTVNDLLRPQHQPE